MPALGLSIGLPYRAGSGVLTAPSAADIIQWLSGNTGDEVADILDPAVLASSVEITDVACLQFDGASYATTTVVMNFGANDYYVSCWINNAYNSGSIERIIDGLEANDKGFRLMQVQTGIYVSHDAYDLIISAPIFLDSTWHHVLVTKIGTTLTLYRDGVFVDDLAVSAGSETVTKTTTLGAIQNGVANWYTGKLALVDLNGQGIYGLSEDSGTTCFDSSGNGNDGTITTADLASMRIRTDGIPSAFAEDGGSIVGAVYVPALTDGSGLDAQGNPITCYPNKVHNGGGFGQMQTTTKCVSKIRAVFIGSPYGGTHTIAWAGENDWLSVGVGRIDQSGSGGKWRLTIGGVETWEHPDNLGSEFPPLDWTALLGSLGETGPTLVYDSFWVDEATLGFAENYWADWLARNNVSQDQVDQWKKINGVCHVVAMVLYGQGTLAGFSSSETNKAIAWAQKYTDDCGAGV